ncbi:MAG: helix-turn-helix transcriptional regulator, partial [Pseudomonadota bacterium]
SYQSFLKVPVAFEQPRAAIVFDAAAMTAPVPGQNADLFAFVDRHFCILRRQLAERSRAPAPSRLMRAIDEGAGSGDYRVSAAAHRAGLSVRAAQRLAMRDGTTLQKMIDDARRARAEALLSDPAISIEAAAALLGYSDDRAFRRAFKRWTGRSPSAYRRQA